METVNLKNELATLQKTIADGAVQFDVKGIKTKIAARQLIGTYLLTYLLSVRYNFMYCMLSCRILFVLFLC